MVLAKHKASVLNVDLASEDGGDAKLNLKIELPPKASGIEIVTDLAETPGGEKGELRVRKARNSVMSRIILIDKHLRRAVSCLPFSLELHFPFVFGL